MSAAKRGRPANVPGPLLHRLAGVWRTDGRLVDAGDGAAAVLAAVDRYEWVPGLPLLAHHVAGHLGRTSVASFEVWAYDGGTRTYASTSFDEHGATSAFVSTLEGRAWTIRGDAQRFLGAFSQDWRTIAGTWHQKHGRSWKPWLDVELRKAGD